MTIRKIYNIQGPTDAEIRRYMGWGISQTVVEEEEKIKTLVGNA